MSKPFVSLRTTAPASAALLFTLCLAGCGSSSKTATSPIVPIPPSKTQPALYIGTENLDNLSELFEVGGGGVWDMTLNSQLGQFSIDDISNITELNGGSPISGDYDSAGSFLNLIPRDGGGVSLNNGYALVLPGEAALMRPGYNGESLVVMAAQSNCLGVKPSTEFVFVAMPNLNWLPQSSPAYGSLQASSSGSGWTFSSISQSKLNGSAASALTIPAGTCLQAEEGSVISIPASSVTGNETDTIAIGPTGYFVMDQGSGNPNDYGPSSLVGVIEPSSAITLSDVTSSKFLGFYYESLAGFSGVPVTQPVAFGQGKHTATTVTGGVFATDNPASTPNADTSIDFGAQDSSTNGLFPHATVVVPDPNAICTGAAVTTTPSGVPGCLLQAAAVVGNANNRQIGRAHV